MFMLHLFVKHKRLKNNFVYLCWLFQETGEGKKSMDLRDRGADRGVRRRGRDGPVVGGVERGRRNIERRVTK